MAITMGNDLEFLTRAINHEIKRRVREISEEEITATQDRIAGKVREAIDSIALSLCSEYSIERMGANIIITAKKLI